jgi:drug/metabolite transporter (DMT)-like permease
MPAPTSARPGATDRTGLLLFVVPTLIWGTTWLVIKFQLGVVAPEVSVAWRFGVAAALLHGWCLARGVPLRLPWRRHLELVVLGLLLFGINYVFTYRSEGYLTSGLVAVLFATMAFWNLLGARVFFGTRAPVGVLGGAALGVAGVVLLFWPEVGRLHAGPEQGLGIALGLAGTLFASAGNLYSQRLSSRGLPVVPSTAWAMAYASLAVLGWCVARGLPLTFDARLPYILSLLYLALFGSVVAFVSYLTLIKRIGAGRSGYSAAVIPVVAMLASTLFEGYRWTPEGGAGLALVCLGTVLTLRARERAAQAA